MHIFESGIIELTHNTNPRAVPSTWQIFNEWGWKNLLNPFHWGVATPISPFAPRIGRVWGCGLGSGVRKQMPPLVFAQACSNSNTSSCSRVCKKSAYQHVVHIQNIHIEIRGFNMFQHIWIPPQSQSASPQPQEPSWNSADTRLVLRHVFFLKMFDTFWMGYNPDAPCMEYLPTFTPKNDPSYVGKYSMHGASGQEDVGPFSQCHSSFLIPALGYSKMKRFASWVWLQRWLESWRFLSFSWVSQSSAEGIPEDGHPLGHLRPLIPSMFRSNHRPPA